MANKIVLIDHNTNEVHVFSSKGSLSDYIHIPRETLVNWFNSAKVIKKESYTLMLVDEYHTKKHPPRPDREEFFKYARK